MWKGPLQPRQEGQVWDALLLGNMFLLWGPLNVPWGPGDEPSETVAPRSSPWIHIITESRKNHFVQNGKGEAMLWLGWAPARHWPTLGMEGGESSGPGSGRFLGSLPTGPSYPCFRFAWEIQNRICKDVTLPFYLSPPLCVCKSSPGLSDLCSL